MAKSQVRTKRSIVLRARHPDQVDVYVGLRMRARRTILGMSQEQLAAALGLTFQQVQKYERGTNRISASRLFQLSRVLEVPLDYFFEGVSEEGADAVLDKKRGGEKNGKDVMARRETLSLVRIYYKIPDQKIRKRLYNMAVALAEQS